MDPAPLMRLRYLSRTVRRPEGRVAGGISVRTQGPDLVCRASMTPVGLDGITASAVQLVCGFGNLATLVAGALQLVGGGLA